MRYLKTKFNNSVHLFSDKNAVLIIGRIRWENNCMESLRRNPDGCISFTPVTNWKGVSWLGGSEDDNIVLANWMRGLLFNIKPMFESKSNPTSELPFFALIAFMTWSKLTLYNTKAEQGTWVLWLAEGHLLQTHEWIQWEETSPSVVPVREALKNAFSQVLSIREMNWPVYCAWAKKSADPTCNLSSLLGRINYRNIKIRDLQWTYDWSSSQGKTYQEKSYRKFFLRVEDDSIQVCPELSMLHGGFLSMNKRPGSSIRSVINYIVEASLTIKPLHLLVKDSPFFLPTSEPCLNFRAHCRYVDEQHEIPLRNGAFQFKSRD